MKELFYFGWMRPGGHYWNVSEYHLIKTFSDVTPSVLKYIDNMYVPMDKVEGVYREVNIGSAKILAWKDYSGDQRMGSNVALIGKGYSNAEEMLVDAWIKFSQYMNRQTKSITPEK